MPCNEKFQLLKKHTWTLTLLPPSRRAEQGVYRIKYKADGSIERC